MIISFQPKRIGPAFFPFHGQSKNKKPNPDMVPYSHDPPGHTCGLPCCSEDLQIRLQKQRPPRSCIGIQDTDNEGVFQQNFIFRGCMKQQPVLENGFFSVQEQRQGDHRDLPEFCNVQGQDMTVADCEEQKRFPFLKGREITLPRSSGPCATEKLYLEDFNFGETDDFLDPDTNSSASEIEYYMTVKNPEDPNRGVPYNPKDIENRQIYPWDLLRDLKDNISMKAQSEKTDDSSSSNYYEVLEVPEDKDKPGLPNVEEKTTEIRGKVSVEDIPPPLPPKHPVQKCLNHPLPGKVNVTLDTNPAKLGNDLDKCTVTNSQADFKPAYNIYSSVCSLTGMANAASKEALEKYRSMDRSASEQKSTRMDIRDFDFGGSKTYLVQENMKITRMTEGKENKEMKLTNKETKTDKTVNYQSGKKIETAEEKVKLLDNMYDYYDDEEDDSGGMINPNFKNVNVDGKILGSRHSIADFDDSANDTDDLHALIWRLGELDVNDSKNEEELEVLKLLKDRLQELDDTVPCVMGHDENPITLIL